MDGNPNTYFKTVYGMGDGDDFLILLSRSIPISSIKITTGDADGNDTVTEGFVDASDDGAKYTKVASFGKDGVATADLHGKSFSSLRIRVNPHTGIPTLLIREIAINSNAAITHTEYGPGRGFVDISQAPDCADWAKRAEQQMEDFWADTAALLYSDKFITPNAVNVEYRTGPNVTGVAATGGGVMTVNADWARHHDDDTGLTVHETAHVIQSMSAYDPVWLIEGIADWIRWVKFEPEHFHPRINVEKATYHDSYQTTATFLGWLELHYDSQLVTKLNKATRFGKYKPQMFKDYCGKDIDTLWAEFIAAYKADPVNIITPPIAAADRPRVVPTVTAGTSVSVDLTSAFNITGIYGDGATFPATSGADSGGAAFPAVPLGADVTFKDVGFKLGPANAPDLVAAKGNVLPVNPASYKSLWILGTAVDGNQMAQSFIVTYTDGATLELVQNMSDWYQPQGYPGESRAVKSPYRVLGDGTKDPRPFFLYSYGFALDPNKTVKSITLPSNEMVRIAAVTLAN